MLGMKAIILAAGEGMRMRPLTLERPKPMLEVAGKPLLRHIWESLPDAVDEVVLVVGYKAKKIREYFGNEFLNRKIKYVEQKEKIGTAGALLLCRPYIGVDEKFLLLYADDLHDKASIEKCMRSKQGILVCKVAHPERFGIIVTNDEGIVTDIEEKPAHPKTNLAAIGVYVLDSRIFDYQPERDANGEYFLTTMIRKMIKDHAVTAHETAFWHPIGYPEDLAAAEKLFKK